MKTIILIIHKRKRLLLVISIKPTIFFFEKLGHMHRNALNLHVSHERIHKLKPLYIKKLDSISECQSRSILFSNFFVHYLCFPSLPPQAWLILWKDSMVGVVFLDPLGGRNGSPNKTKCGAALCFCRGAAPHPCWIGNPSHQYAAVPYSACTWPLDEQRKNVPFQMYQVGEWPDCKLSSSRPNIEKAGLGGPTGQKGGCSYCHLSVIVYMKEW